MKKIATISIILILLAVGVYLYTSSKSSEMVVDNKCNISENVYTNNSLGYHITVPANWYIQTGQDRDRFIDCNKSMRENDFQIVKGALYTKGRQKTRELPNLIPSAVVSEWYSSEEDDPGYKYDIKFSSGETFSLFPIYPDLKIERYHFISTFKLFK